MGATDKEAGARPSSSQQADLWEHASLLYHNLDWQSAADVFNHLSISAVEDESRAKCILNEGLIFARLGDLNVAKKLFERAAALDPAEVLPCFLIGLIEAESNHLTEALTQFEFCWETLQRGLADHYSPRLRFELTADMCRRNAEKTWAKLKAQHEGKTQPPLLLESLPADMLFEAPTRRAEGDPQRSSASRKTLETMQASARSTSSKVWSYLRSLDQANTPRTSTSTSEDVVHAQTSEPQLPVLEPLPKPKLMLIPREPQVRDESLRELASFIRYAGPGGSKEVTIDRDYMLRLLDKDQAGVPDVSLSGRSLEAPPIVDNPTTRANVNSEIDSVLEYSADSCTRRHSDPEPAVAAVASSEGGSVKDPNKLIEDTIAELKRQAFGDIAFRNDGDTGGGSLPYLSRISDMHEIEHIPSPLSPRPGRTVDLAKAPEQRKPAESTIRRRPVMSKAERLLLGNTVGTSVLSRPTLPSPTHSRSPKLDGDHND